MNKLKKAGLAVVLGLIALVVIGWLVVVPREMKNLWRFSSWPEQHARASGAVERAPAGTRIHWQEFGDRSGPAVVVLPAGLCPISVMVGQIEALAAASFRVIAIDSRGLGKSTNTGTSMTYEMMADDVVAVLDALHIQSAAAVGWSDGGIISLDLARRYGNRVTKVVAFGANHTPAPDGQDREETQTFKEAKADSALFWPMRRMYERESPTPQRWAEQFKQEQRMAFTQPNWSLAQLGAITVPVLLINGEHDLVLRPYAEEMRAAIPGSRLEIVRGETHMLPLANPDAANPPMLSFLR
jgi:pimeloyl-ACP methyl ester carboxylesterase